MSEDDRAAKAARAKAMLKKRQQKKGGGPSTPSATDVASPVTSAPESRAFSPAPSVDPTAPADHLDTRDLASIFSKDNNDTSWINSLPRATPPPQMQPRSPPQSTPVPQQTGPDPRDAVIEEHIRTISALESDKSSLEYQLERLKDVESKFRETQNLLTKESARAQALQQIKDQHETQLQTERSRVQALETKAKQSQVEKANEIKQEQAKTRALQDEIQQLQAEKEKQLENERQTIAVLVTEKSSLTANLERFEDIEIKAQQFEESFNKERATSQSLNDSLQRLQAEASETARRETQLIVSEKEWSDKSREQERELQLMSATVENLRSEKEQHRRKLRDLEDQIQSDDRVERLEGSLKNTQDRAEELEFQLSKLKQANTVLKAEREDLDSQLRTHREGESEWQAKYSALEAEHSAAQRDLASATAEKETLSQDGSTAQARFEAMQKTFVELQEQLAKTAAELTSNSRQLQNAQNDLRNSNRRAEEAERMQKELQTEGTALMRSLDEMRPKIVELTGAKLELAEKVDSLEHTLRSRDAVIADLEAVSEEITAQRDALNQGQQEIHALREKEQLKAQESSTELQTLYSELQAELDETRQSVLTMQTERTRHHQDATKHAQEFERLTMALQRQTEALELAQAQFAQEREAQEDGQEYLERAQTEIENLRAEVNMRDEEIERLQGSISSATPIGVAPSLDSEMLSSLRQQHALDLSAAQSQIRALETSVFDAEARAHTMEKHAKVLEDHLDKLRSHSRNAAGANRSFSPAAGPSRPLSRSTNISSRNQTNQAPLVRSVLDQNMPSEILHKRRVSLGMLKARIESEVAHASPSQHPLATVQEPSHSGSSSPVSQTQSHSHYYHRPQFLDENHIIWCHSCKGDLVVL